MRRTTWPVGAMLGAVLAGACAEAPAPLAEFTWISNTTWLIEVDGIQVFVDAAVSRWAFARPDFSDPASFAPAPVTPDTGLVRDVIGSISSSDAPTYIVVGHSHTDHAIDLGLFADMTSAEVIGSRSACLLAEAQGLPPTQCHPVEGGEVFELTPQLTARVVRWAHSGNPSDRLGRFIQAPKELRVAPAVDPTTGGIGQAPWHGYPNGGGARAYLFEYSTSGRTLRWLVSDTGNRFTFDSIPQIGADYLSDVGVDLSHLEFVEPAGAPREWLTSAVYDAEIDSVDVWLGYGDVEHVRQVTTILSARLFVPHHWDAYISGFRPGIQRPFVRPALAQLLADVGTSLVIPTQYLDRFELTPKGFSPVENDSLQAALGLELR